MTDSLLSLPSIRTLLHHYGITADKKLGQHFLFDQNLTDNIVRHAGNLENMHVIEVGPGPGVLTRSILQANPASLLAIETDERFIHMLGDYLLPLTHGRLKLLHQDALRFDYTSIPTPLCIIANLPYNIGTELLFLWLKNITHFTSLTVMLQKEVAQRLLASQNNKAYGRLSILFQRVCNIHLVCDIPPHAFFPPPKVMSSVVHIVPRPDPIPAHAAMLDRLLRVSFGQRRKMLRVSLRHQYPGIEAVLEQTAFSTQARPEALSVEDFCTLSNILSKTYTL